MRRMTLFLGVLLAAGAGVIESGSAQEIGYIEEFALAEDRADALDQLIPGTEEYYYYHCLHYLNTEQFDRVAATLAAWIDRHSVTGRVREIQHRQALLTYNRRPEATLDYLRDTLNLRFNHQRQAPDARPDLPTRLDSQLISFERLSERALQQYRNLDGFEPSANDWLVGASLAPERRRELLSRLQRPDYPGLVEMIIADLEYRNSGGFGSLPVHSMLLLDQLEACADALPTLLSNGNFVNVYLTKLQPSNDVEWQYDAEAKREYLDRLWAFAERLPPVHNSLKAHVLYHRLLFDREQGEYDRERFLTYLRLPRPVGYMRPEYLERSSLRRFHVNLGAGFPTGMQPIGNDEELVKSYLQHFFLDAGSYSDPFATYIREEYLKRVFAETKIVNGLGDPEQWYSLLSPAEYQALKDRVDLDFAHTNNEIFRSDEPVSLDLFVKNVDSLIVKVFEINTFNYYRQYGRHVDTGINLDGLVANEEMSYAFDVADVLRVRRHFEFPELRKPGVYVIDFIGSGESSRVVVRKGRLRYLTRQSTAGVEFTILDEENQVLDDAELWMAGHEYQADADGTIVVPYSTRPGSQAVILTHGGFSWLENFDHPAENYQLAAGIYVDRESLLSGQSAEVVVRPMLYLNGVPVSLSILEDVRLRITSMDREGISSSMEVEPFELFEDRESTHTFQVPPRLSSVTFQLEARVKVLSRDEHVDLAAADSFSVNAIDTTEKVEQLLLARVNGNWAVDLLGRNGEARPDRVIQFVLKHEDFRDAVQVSLQTDPRGRVRLGSLDGISYITATAPEGTSQTWPLRDDDHTRFNLVHAREQDVIELPYMGSSDEPQRDELSLLELRGNTFVYDRFESIGIENGMLKLTGLSRGDYDLWIKEEGIRIRIRVTEGRTERGFVLGHYRQLELRGNDPLQIAEVAAADNNVRIELVNASPFARVHVFATRFEPEFSAFGHLARTRDAEPYMMRLPEVESMYVEGRNIGDEYRYIIERRHAQKFPGNMLDRPSLLLNPWPIRTTETGRQDAAAGEAFDRRAPETAATAERPDGRADGDRAQGSFPNLNFLANTSAVLLNVVPEGDAAITIPRSELGNHQQLVVVAVDPDDCVVRHLSLPPQDTELTDLRQQPTLDPEQHYTQRKKISIVAGNEPFVVEDIVSSRFEVFRDLQSVYSLMVTLSTNPTLLEFQFITRWPELTDEEKREKYSEFACHELNYFIWQKDPKFFQSVVRPYLDNKMERTYLDLWLLEQGVAEYREPWHYERLNTVERILLGQRIEEEEQYTTHLIDNSYDLLPPNPDQMLFWFESALKNEDLDATRPVDEVLREARSEARALGRQLADFESGQGGAMGGFGGGGGMAGRRGGRGPAGGAPPSPSDPFSSPGADGAVAESEPANGEPAASARFRRRGLDLQEESAAETFYADDLARRGQIQQLYQQIDKTQEWVENHYYHLPLEQQTAALITPNAMWKDYAHHDGESPFFSIHFAEATGNFPEMMFALSVLDLPFKGGELETEADGSRVTLTCRTPMVVFHEELQPTTDVASETTILVSQNFYPHGERYRTEDNEQVDNYVSEEFLTHRVYGCQVVVTNPSSSRQKLDILLQVPSGAIPVLGSRYTRSVPLTLEPFHTQTVEYHFYFPRTGEFPHYPVHVSSNDQILAFADAMVFRVVDTPTNIDRNSWAYVSQNGTEEEVLAFLEQKNLQRIDLSRIAFRMKDKTFFLSAIDVLARRHAYDHTLWSYAVMHNTPPQIQEYLQHSEGFVQQCGAYLVSPLLVIDPFERRYYQHMDYRPLVNARAHQLGERRQIVNDRFHQQYHRLLHVLTYRRELSDQDLSEVTLYMLLQDRVEEAIAFHQRVNPQNLEVQLQHDYMSAYIDFYLERPEEAREIVEQYVDYPVDRWREVFQDVAVQLEEIQSGLVTVTDGDDDDSDQSELAATAPTVDVTVEARRVRIDYQNVTEAVVNYYEMDIELLFSRNPFVQQFAGQFSHIRPNHSQEVELPEAGNSFEFELPAELHNRNVLVEVRAGGQVATQAYYANALNVQLIENYGQLRVRNQDTGQAMPRVYVKVYARMQDGSVQFYKDGYTDLRGRFDYTSLNTNQLDFVQQFAILVLSDEDGAIVREATPPKQ